MKKNGLPFVILLPALAIAMFAGACALTEMIWGEATATPLPGNGAIATKLPDIDIADVREGKKLHDFCGGVRPDFSNAKYVETRWQIYGRICPRTDVATIGAVTGKLILGAEYATPQNPNCSVWRPVVQVVGEYIPEDLVKLGQALVYFPHSWICTEFTGFIFE